MVTAAEGGSFLRMELVLDLGQRLLFLQSPSWAGEASLTIAPTNPTWSLPSISDLNFGCCRLLKSSKILSPFSRSTLVVMAATSPGWSLATVWSQGPEKRGEQGQTGHLS